jgi:hypothetical protein
MLRENTFRLGGALTVALGLALAAGLVWSGAGLEFFEGYAAAAFAVGFGVFFFSVGVEEGRERRRRIAELERNGPSAP